MPLGQQRYCGSILKVKKRNKNSIDTHQNISGDDE